jgi:3-deoxy-manno-octulosonate cytidylyltransferase (CMP-KDO synthetase)
MQRGNTTGSAGLIIIPARYQSSRFPGKPLAMVRGATGIAKPLLQRSVEAATTALPGVPIAIATDDPRIAALANTLGVGAIDTPASCANGTERVAAALATLDDVPPFVINFQGDALLTPPDCVVALARHMQAHPDCAVATAGVRCSPSTYAHLLADQAAGRSGGTTVVTRSNGRALYFSKRVLPFLGGDRLPDADTPVLLHLGLYAYRPAALRHYAQLPPSPLEIAEGLEQLRFIANDIDIDVILFDPPGWDAIELNNPSDLAPIEAVLATRGIE